MAAVEADIQSEFVELSGKAFKAFRDDIAETFGTTVVCAAKRAGFEAVKDLRKSFRTLTAVHLVEASGTLDGQFYLIFDQAGLFVLSGATVMLPAKKIRKDVRHGALHDAEDLADATREVGNLLVGSWERTFHKECQDHDHFSKTATVIGEPWDRPPEVKVSANEDVLVVLYEMRVDTYPSFHCAAVFPKAVMGKARGRVDDALSELAGPLDVEATAVAPEESDVPARDPIDEVLSGRVEILSDSRDLQAVVDTVVEDVEDTVSNVARQVTAEVVPGQPVQDDLDRILVDVSSHPVDATATERLDVPARDIMATEVTWSYPDDMVQDVLAKMQKNDTGYVLIGSDNVPQGLVSNSNILGAISPYLRPMLAKWRRPEDESTLRIKVKWIMSRPVRTVNLDTPLADMIQNMCRYGGRCLPVVDDHGQVHGIVTVFDILRHVVGPDRSGSWDCRTPQAPPSLL